MTTLVWIFFIMNSLTSGYISYLIARAIFNSKINKFKRKYKIS